jgi:transposase
MQGREPVDSLLFFDLLLPTHMTTIQLNKTSLEIKPSIFAWIDVGAEELVLVIRKDGTPSVPQTFFNNLADRSRLVKKLVKLTGIRICLEATGANHLDLAIGRHDAGVLLMVVNPKAAHNFAKVLIPKGHK